MTGSEAPPNAPRPSPNFLASLRYALSGLAWVARSQRNLRIQAAIGSVALVLGLWLGLQPVEWAVLAVVMGLVLATEALNSAIERAVDLASPAIHPVAKQAKDAAAGAVLLASLASLAVGALLFIPRLLERLGG